jgi:hypothetical protein
MNLLNAQLQGASPASIDTSAVGRWITDWLVHSRLEAFSRQGPFEIMWWQWIALLIVVAVAWWGGRLLGAITLGVLRRVSSRTTTVWDDKLFDSLAPPIGVAWTLALFAALGHSIGLPDAGERVIAQFVRGTWVATIFWSLWRSVDVFVELHAVAAMGHREPVDAQPADHRRQHLEGRHRRHGDRRRPGRLQLSGDDLAGRPWHRRPGLRLRCAEDGGEPLRLDFPRRGPAVPGGRLRQGGGLRRHGRGHRPALDALPDPRPDAHQHSQRQARRPAPGVVHGPGPHAPGHHPRGRVRHDPRADAAGAGRLRAGAARSTRRSGPTPWS